MVYQCPKPTHFNYNSDQLAKIFRLMGTPSDTKFLSRMHCLAHFQGWPAYPRKLEEIVNGACTAERMTQAGEGAAQSLAEQWASCLSGMLVIDPAERHSASDVMGHAFWKPCAADAAGEMPIMRSRHSSTGSQASTVSAHSTGSSEKPKLAMSKSKRNSAPASTSSKVPLQPMQAQHQRRTSHSIPSEGLLSERGGPKDLVRRSAGAGELLVTGGGMSSSIAKTALMPRTKSNVNTSNNSMGGAIVRVCSLPGYAKGKIKTSSWNFMGRSNNMVVADSIV